MSSISHITKIALLCFTASVVGWCAQSAAADDSTAKPIRDPFAQVDPASDPYGTNKIPDAVVGIGVDDSNNGNLLDTNTPFRNHKNDLVRIGDLFDGVKPVILSFNYSDCPKLCSVQLENMIETLGQIDLEIGDDYRIASISIDPKESTARAQESLDKYSKQYNRASALKGMHFLVGEESAIKKITGEVGFKYKYIEDQKRYSHPPLFVIVSPKGKLVRYIHGLDYDPKTMNLALVEAAEGKIGSPLNLASYGLGCFVFDESTGKYTFQAMSLMKIGGGLTVLLLVVTLTPYWFFKSANKKNSSTLDTTRSDASPTLTDAAD